MNSEPRTVWHRRIALPLSLTGIPLGYWREEVRLGCAVSLTRLRAICTERGADYQRTINELMKEGEHSYAELSYRVDRSHV